MQPIDGTSSFKEQFIEITLIGVRHIYQDDHGRDLHGMAQIIIAKHRKGATGDVLLTFRGEFTRFENPEDRRLGSKRPDNGGEILGSKMNDDAQPSADASPFGGFEEPAGPLPF